MRPTTPLSSKWRRFNRSAGACRAAGRGSGLKFRRFVSAQTVVNDGNLRQRKISERDAFVIRGMQNDVREHVANLADNLEQDRVLFVCHGSYPFRSSKSSRFIGLPGPSRAAAFQILVLGQLPPAAAETSCGSLCGLARL